MHRGRLQPATRLAAARSRCSSCCPRCGHRPAADDRLRVMVPEQPGRRIRRHRPHRRQDHRNHRDHRPGRGLQPQRRRRLLALTRLMHENGNPDLVMMMGLGVIGATVTNKSTATVTDATPIARLIEEQEGVMVPADSPYRTIDDLMSAWRAHPDEFVVGGGSPTGGPDHLMSMRTGRGGRIDAGRGHLRRPMTAAASCCRRCWRTRSISPLPGSGSTPSRSSPASCGCWRFPAAPGCRTSTRRP